MATNPEDTAGSSLDDGVQSRSTPEQGVPLSNAAARQVDEGDKKRKTEDGALNHTAHPSATDVSATDVSADGASQAAPVFSQHFGMSSHLYSSPYIGQADDSGNLVSSSMMPGSLAQNSVYSAAQVSAAQRSGHVIGEADITAVSTMGSNAAVSQHLGISQVGMSQVGISGPYGDVGSMAGTMGYSAGQYTMAGGQFTGGYHPGSSNKMAMPGEIMGTVTLPIYNVSPYPVPVTGSSQHGQQQYHHHIQNMGAPVGETEWHRNDTGVQQSHYMRDGSTATNFGSVLLTHTNRQPLSQENVAAMQHQDDTLLAAKLEQAQLSEEYEGGQKNADLGRTDSKRGLRGAMAPMHTGTSAAEASNWVSGGSQQWVSGGSA